MPKIQLEILYQLIVTSIILSVLIFTFIVAVLPSIKNQKDAALSQKLSILSSKIKKYSTSNDRLPNNIAEVETNKDVYRDIEYQRIDAYNITKRFRLCSNFNSDTLSSKYSNYYEKHGKSKFCFDEEIQTYYK